MRALLGKIFYRSPEFLFRFLSRNGLAGLAALFFYLTLRKIKNGTPPVSKDAYKILMMPRVVFTEDVIFSLGGSAGFSIFAPLDMTIKGLAHGILPSYLDDNFYVTDKPEAEEQKRVYRDFLKRMWTKLHRYIRFDAVVTGNFSYYAERVLAAALEALGVPFIAMHKDNLKSAGRIEFSKAIYRERKGPFTGRRILVYNEKERRLQIEAGIAPPNRITVCGMPRLDRLHEWRRTDGGRTVISSQRPQVLFFSFTPKTILPRISRRAGADLKGNVESLDEGTEAMNWNQLAERSHQAIMRLAKDTPGIDVVIKTKMRKREWTEMYRMLGERHDLPPNLKIVIGGDPTALILESHVVCGFNTTALFEAVAAGKPVIVPRFAEALDERLRPFIVDLEDAVDYADSDEDLIVLLRQKAHEKSQPPVELDPVRIHILEQWVGNGDGRSGDRVRSAVLAEIEGSEIKGAYESHG